MTEPSLTAKAAVSLRILKQNLKENCYFHPVHGVPCSEWYAMKWCRKYPYFRTSILFFQNWLFIWGREVMKLKGNYNNVLVFFFWNIMKTPIDISTFTRKRNTHWKQLCLAMQDPSETLQALNQFLRRFSVWTHSDTAALLGVRLQWLEKPGT